MLDHKPQAPNPLGLAHPDLFCQAALIDGEWVQADGGAVTEVTDPATGATIGHIPNMGKAETVRAAAEGG